MKRFEKYLTIIFLSALLKNVDDLDFLHIIIIKNFRLSWIFFLNNAKIAAWRLNFIFSDRNLVELPATLEHVRTDI